MYQTRKLKYFPPCWLLNYMVRGWNPIFSPVCVAEIRWLNAVNDKIEQSYTSLMIVTVYIWKNHSHLPIMKNRNLNWRYYRPGTFYQRTSSGSVPGSQCFKILSDPVILCVNASHNQLFLSGSYWGKYSIYIYISYSLKIPYIYI